MAYTKKMHEALRRDTDGKKNATVDLLDEIDRLQKLVDGREPTLTVYWARGRSIEYVPLGHATSGANVIGAPHEDFYTA